MDEILNVQGIEPRAGGVTVLPIKLLCYTGDSNNKTLPTREMLNSLTNWIPLGYRVHTYIIIDIFLFAFGCGLKAKWPNHVLKTICKSQ